MKILQITPSYKPAYIYGGPIMSVAALSEELTNSGNEVMVYTTLANGKDELSFSPKSKQLIDGVEVTYFKRITKDHSHFSPDLLIALWRTGRYYDVVHIHSWWNTVAVLSAFICRVRGIRFVVSPRGMFSPYSMSEGKSFVKKCIHSLFGKWILKAQNLHATSTSELKQLEKAIYQPTVHLVFNFVKFSNSVLSTDRNKIFKLLFLSRVDPKKGLELLIDSLAFVNFNFELEIAGSGDAHYIDSIKKKINGLKLSGNIKWLGELNSESKFQYLAKADLLVLPSRDENFGNVVIESLSSGTPVLVSQQVGLADYIRENELGWICELNVESLKLKLNEAVDSLHKKKFNRLRASELIRNKFSGNHLREEYLEMYRKVIRDE